MRDSKKIHLGCEYLLNEKIRLRGGYEYDPWCIPEEQTSPLAPANTYHSLHLGLGMTLGHFTLDLALSGGISDRDKEITFTETGYPGKYETPCYAIDVALTYYF